jgi:hypothetical protein
VKTLPDLLALAGFAALMSGLLLVAGTGWALVAGGALMMAAGLVATWRRHSP